jgi:aerobic C4-dicarboxylate transport protein
VTAEAAKKPWCRVFYAQALDAIAVGWLRSNLGTIDWIKAPGNGFIKPIKRVIAPIVFCTVVSGIAHIQDARAVGRIGVTALIHLEIVSTFALGLGPVAGNLVRPAVGLGGAMPMRRRTSIC